MTTALFHQAHFLPWPGYISRCLDCDIIVYLSDVHFNKGYYHNRTKYIDINQKLQWLTIPIKNNPTSKLLKDSTIVEPLLFKKWFRKFKISYSKYNDFEEYWSVLEAIFIKNYPSINLINQELIKHLVITFCNIRGYKIPKFYDSSEFVLKFENRTDRLEKISSLLGINRILMGTDSLRVHNINSLASKGIKCNKHVFKPNDENKRIPTSGLSIVHYILTYGWKATMDELETNWDIINN